MNGHRIRTILLAAACLIATGCLPPRGGNSGRTTPEPTPPGQTSHIERAASDRIEAMAVEADRMAETAAEFKSIDAALADWKARNTKATEEHGGKLAAEVDRHLGDESAAYDPAKLAEAARAVARGYRRGGADPSRGSGQ